MDYEMKVWSIDGYIDATELCKVGGKEFSDYNRDDGKNNKNIKDFLELLSYDLGIPRTKLI